MNVDLPYCTGNCIDFSLAAWFNAVRAFAVASVVLSLPVLLLAINCERTPGRGLQISAAILAVQGENFCTNALFRALVHLRFNSSFLYHFFGCLCCRGTTRRRRFIWLLLHPRLVGCCCIHCRSRYLLTRESSPQHGRLQ